MEVKDLRQELSLRESQLINEKKNALQLIEEEENKIDLGKVTLMIANSAASSLEKKTFDDEDVQVNYSDDEDELLSR